MDYQDGDRDFLFACFEFFGMFLVIILVGGVAFCAAKTLCGVPMLEFKGDWRIVGAFVFAGAVAFFVYLARDLFGLSLRQALISLGMVAASGMMFAFMA